MRLIDFFKTEVLTPKVEFTYEPIADKFRLGLAAQDLLKNLAFMEAIRRAEMDYFTIWKNSKPLEVEGRESAWRMFRAIFDIKIKIQGLINAMIQEQKKLEDENKLKLVKGK